MPRKPALFTANASPRIAIVAGEASGDALGASLVQVLRQRLPGAEFVGIGGPKMQTLGVTSLFAMEKLAVRGYVEVLKHLRELLALRRSLRRQLLAAKPDVFIGIDAPDFNLALERKFKSAGIPTLHYVSPSIWAWRGERVHKIKAATNTVMCLFPFETPLYDAVGAPANYVGHPLADEMAVTVNINEVRDLLGVPLSKQVFALLPGSRLNEVERHADLFIETAKLLCTQYPDALFLVPLVTRETRVVFENALYRLSAHELPIRLMFGHAHEAMQAANVVLVASGTATLEAMLAKRPMVITYKLAPSTYKIVKRKMQLPWVGLPNVLAGRFVVPELLQDEATPDNLAQALGNLLDDKTLAANLTEEFTTLHLALRRNAAERAAEVVIKTLRGRL